MAKTAAERQRERRARLKESEQYSKYKKKAAEQKKVLRKQKLKKESAKEKEIRLEKNRINVANYRMKQKEKKPDTVSSPFKAFGSSQALGKALSRAKKSLPNSPRKREAIVRKLAVQYSPKLPPVIPISKNGIDESVKQAVINFYSNDVISSQAPGLRDFIIIRDESGKTKIQKRYLQLTLGEIYKLFQEENPTLKIGFSKFASLRPKHICLRQETPNNMCLCIYHENIRLLLESASCFSNSTSEFVKTIVCDDENEKCMLQTCENCKDLKLFRRFVENLNSSELELESNFRQWIKCEDGKLVRNKRNGVLNDVVELLEKNLPYFLWHVYVKRRQSKYLENLKSNIPYGTLVFQADFSENYAHIYQDEIQSAHWQNTSTTLYTTMLYYRGKPDNANVSFEPYVVVSDYLNHDKYAVITFNNLILERFTQKHPEFSMKRIEFISDGTSQHFKQKYTIYSMTQSKLSTVWHFSATSHGKGCIDGIGGTVKRCVREASRARMIDPRTSLEFAEAAMKTCPGINILFSSEKNIQAMKADYDNLWIIDGQEIKGIPGTRKAHCFRSYSEGNIFYSSISDSKKGVMFNFKTGECKENFSVPLPRDSEEFQCGQWVTATYDNEKFNGVIIKIEKELYQVKCLVPTNINGLFKFESEDHAVWYDKKQIVPTNVSPSLVNSRGFYKL